MQLDPSTAAAGGTSFVLDDNRLFQPEPPRNLSLHLHRVCNAATVNAAVRIRAAAEREAASREAVWRAAASQKVRGLAGSPAGSLEPLCAVAQLRPIAAPKPPAGPISDRDTKPGTESNQQLNRIVN